jgi:hypothetical protein
MTLFDHTGLWWIPPDRETVIAGTLSFDGESPPRLRLVGSFQTLADIPRPFRPPIILGVAGGKEITLFRCLGVGNRITMPGIHTSDVLANFVLEGHHFETDTAVVFDAIWITFDHLLGWSGLSGIRAQPMREENRVVGLEVAYHMADFPSLAFPGGTVRFVQGFQTQASEIEGSYTIREDLAIEIRPSAPLPLQTYLDDYVYHLQNFVSLGLGGATRIRQLRGRLSAPSERGRIGYDEKSIEIVFRSRGADASKAIHPGDMLFRATDLGADLGSAFGTWLARAAVLSPVIDLYFGTLFGKGLYVEHRFLSVAQALESYHRRVIGGTYLAHEVWSGILASLVQAIEAAPLPRDVREAFQQKLRYFNEVSLRRRLKELTQRVSGLIDAFIPDSMYFVRRIVGTRNYLTHYDDASLSESVSGQDLQLLSEQMQGLLEVLLLREVGFNDDQVKLLVERHQRYLRVAQAVRDGRVAPVA